MQQKKLQKSSKSFKGDFDLLLTKLKEGVNFSFSRFSDGELYILKNQKLTLSEEGTFCNDKDYDIIYPDRDLKEFNPDKDSFYRDRLVDAFKYNAPNYYKGLTCRCCGTDEQFDWQIEFMGEGDHNLTWANLWLNANYKHFVEELVPAFDQRKLVFVCNEDAQLRDLPFNILKHFVVGRNCLVNNYNLVEDIKAYIDDNSLEDCVFLFSAASLSNILCHQLFEHSNKNTYIDIGTSMHPYFGFELQRAYLQEYWLNEETEFGDRECIW